MSRRVALRKAMYDARRHGREGLRQPESGASAHAPVSGKAQAHTPTNGHPRYRTGNIAVEKCKCAMSKRGTFGVRRRPHKTAQRLIW